MEMEIEPKKPYQVGYVVPAMVGTKGWFQALPLKWDFVIKDSKGRLFVNRNMILESEEEAEFCMRKLVIESINPEVKVLIKSPSTQLYLKQESVRGVWGKREEATQFIPFSDGFKLANSLLKSQPDFEFVGYKNEDELKLLKEVVK